MASFTIKNQWNGNPSRIKDFYCKVSVDISATTGEFIIQIDAPYLNDPAPFAQEPGRLVGLWDYEVVEFFISDVHGDDYLEIEVGPHGHWYCSFFSINFGQDDTIALEYEPKIAIDKEKKRWTCRLALPSMYLPEPETDFMEEMPLALRWLANAYLIHGTEKNNNREYLSFTRLPGESPNFHQPNEFTPIILQETDPNRHNSVAVRSYSVSPKNATLSSQSFNSNNNLTTRLLAELGKDNNNLTNGVELSDSFKFNNKSEPKTVAEISKMIRARNEKYLLTIENSYKNHIQEDEIIIQEAHCWKRKGWSYKKRSLILTDKPRLLYVDYKNNLLKGLIFWTHSAPIKAVRKGKNHFDICLFDKSRNYHWSDKDGSERWIDSINLLSEAMVSYMKRMAKNPTGINPPLTPNKAGGTN